MATQGQRQNFQWRPNTNDSTTLARYDQEAQLWVRAFKNANRPKSSFSDTMGTVGLVLQLIFHILLLAFMLLKRLFVFLKNS